MSDTDERKAKKRKVHEEIDELINVYESENMSLKKEVRLSKQLQDETDQLKVQVQQLQEKLLQTESRLELGRMARRSVVKLWIQSGEETRKISSHLKAELDAKAILVKELDFLKKSIAMLMGAAMAAAFKESSAPKASEPREVSNSGKSSHESGDSVPEPNKISIDGLPESKEVSKAGSSVPEPGNDGPEEVSNVELTLNEVEYDSATNLQDSSDEDSSSADEDSEFEPGSESEDDYDEPRNVVSPSNARDEQQPRDPQLQPVVSMTQIFLPGPGGLTQPRCRNDPILDIYVRRTPRNKEEQRVRHLFQIFAAEKRQGLHPQLDWKPRNKIEGDSVVFIRNYLTGQDHCESKSWSWENSKGWDELVQALGPHEAQKVGNILRGTRWVAESLFRNIECVMHQQEIDADKDAQTAN